MGGSSTSNTLMLTCQCEIMGNCLNQVFNSVKISKIMSDFLFVS